MQKYKGILKVWFVFFCTSLQNLKAQNYFLFSDEPDMIWLSCGQSRNIYLISIESGEVMDKMNLDSDGDREVEEMMLVKNRSV